MVLSGVLKGEIMTRTAILGGGLLKLPLQYLPGCYLLIRGWKRDTRHLLNLVIQS